MIGSHRLLSVISNDVASYENKPLMRTTLTPNQKEKEMNYPKEFSQLKCPVCNVQQSKKPKDWNCQYCSCGSLFKINNFYEHWKSNPTKPKEKI